jgi:hypothetical protein
LVGGYEGNQTIKGTFNKEQLGIWRHEFWFPLFHDYFPCELQDIALNNPVAMDPNVTMDTNP